MVFYDNTVCDGFTHGPYSMYDLLYTRGIYNLGECFTLDLHIDLQAHL